MKQMSFQICNFYNQLHNISSMIVLTSEMTRGVLIPKLLLSFPCEASQSTDKTSTCLSMLDRVLLEALF